MPTDETAAWTIFASDQLFGCRRESVDATFETSSVRRRFPPAPATPVRTSFQFEVFDSSEYSKSNSERRLPTPRVYGRHFDCPKYSKGMMMKSRKAISDFSAGALKENTLVAVIEDVNGGIKGLVGLERVKSRGQSNQRPYVTFRSGSKFNRLLGTFNGRKAWLFIADDDLLRELAGNWKALESNRLAIKALVNG